MMGSVMNRQADKCSLPCERKHMTEFVFDHSPARRDSDSTKWQKYADRDVLPMWVADMDFASPPAVQAALAERVAHGVYGYPDPLPGVVAAVTDWLQRSYQWQIDPAWLVWLPGLVCGLNVACRSVGQAGDAVMTATPVYPPFMSAPRLSGRTLITVPMQDTAAGWQWDWAAAEAALTPSTRLLMLCHPHNPVGRVFDRAELDAVAEFARRHDLVVCSDEIHCQLILDQDRQHLPFASLSADAAARSITLMAPSKTYNVPGLGCAFAIIPDAGLRARFSQTMRGIVPGVNLFGFVGAQAAYRDSPDWLNSLLAVLRRNRDRVEAVLGPLEGMRVTHSQGTYLAWIDVRSKGWANPVAEFEAGGVGLSDGADFGLPGYVRLNFGCPLAQLEEALARMVAVWEKPHQ